MFNSLINEAKSNLNCVSIDTQNTYYNQTRINKDNFSGLGQIRFDVEANPNLVHNFKSSYFEIDLELFRIFKDSVVNPKLLFKTLPDDVNINISRNPASILFQSMQILIDDKLVSDVQNFYNSDIVCKSLICSKRYKRNNDNLLLNFNGLNEDDFLALGAEPITKLRDRKKQNYFFRGCNRLALAFQPSSWIFDYDQFVGASKVSFIFQVNPLFRNGIFDNLYKDFTVYTTAEAKSYAEGNMDKVPVFENNQTNSLILGCDVHDVRLIVYHSRVNMVKQITSEPQKYLMTQYKVFTEELPAQQKINLQLNVGKRVKAVALSFTYRNLFSIANDNNMFTRSPTDLGVASNVSGGNTFKFPIVGMISKMNVSYGDFSELISNQKIYNYENNGDLLEEEYLHFVRNTKHILEEEENNLYNLRDYVANPIFFFNVGDKQKMDSSTRLNIDIELNKISYSFPGVQTLDYVENTKVVVLCFYEELLRITYDDMCIPRSMELLEVVE